MATNLLLRIGGYIDNQVRSLKSMSAQRDLATSTLCHRVVAISVNRSQNQRSVVVYTSWPPLVNNSAHTRYRALNIK